MLHTCLRVASKFSSGNARVSDREDRYHEAARFSNDPGFLRRQRGEERTTGGSQSTESISGISPNTWHVDRVARSHGKKLTTAAHQSRGNREKNNSKKLSLQPTMSLSQKLLYRKLPTDDYAKAEGAVYRFVWHARRILASRILGTRNLSPF